MSNHLTSLAYKLDVRGLCPRESGLTALPLKSVLVRLADWASDDGQGIWASKQTIADELCASKQFVITAIQRLLDCKILHVVGQRKCATGHTVEYRLDVHAMENLPRVKRWANKESTGLTGHPGLPVNGVDGRGQLGGPKPSKNQEKDSSKSPAREIPDDWRPTLKPDSETAKETGTWPERFYEQTLEAFIAYHQAHKTKSENFNRQWKTWVFSEYQKRNLREWKQDERSGPRGPFGDNEIANAASRLLGELAGTRQ